MKMKLNELIENQIFRSYLSPNSSTVEQHIESLIFNDILNLSYQRIIFIKFLQIHFENVNIFVRLGDGSQFLKKCRKIILNAPFKLDSKILKLTTER